MAITFCSIMLSLEVIASSEHRRNTCPSPGKGYMIANGVGLFRKEVAHLWKQEKIKKCNSSLNMPMYLLTRQLAEVQPDFDWPLVPKAPDPRFNMTGWFYLLVLIWWLCYMPLVWT